MNIPAKVIVNLCGTQAGQFNKIGECMFIEPVEPQLKLGKDGITVEYKGEYYLDMKTFIVCSKYKCKQLVIVIIKAEGKPEKLRRQAVITDVNVKRVQELNVWQTKKLLGKIDFGRMRNQFKEYFDQQFTQPIPVYSEIVTQGMIDALSLTDEILEEESIENFILYSYDGECNILERNSQKEFYNSEVTFTGLTPMIRYKNRPLKVIINPFFYIVTLIIQSG